MSTNNFAVQVHVSSNVVSAHVEDRRHEAVAIFTPLSAEQQEHLAKDAWSVGLRALMNAYRQAEEARLEDIGSGLMMDLGLRLQAHVDGQQKTLAVVLERYFDPRTGELNARMEGFVKDGGDLPRALEKYLAPEHGMLAKTLARELGETSPLLRRLSPTDSEGIVALIEGKVSEALASSHTAMAQALDPTSEGGAVARFLRSLREEMGKSDQDRTKQLATLTKAIDANDPGSLLNQLVRETQKAQRSLLQAMNPEQPGSPLAIVKTSLTSLLAEHAKTQTELSSRAAETQQKLMTEVRDIVTRMEERKRGQAKSTHGGFDFEEAVVRFAQQAVHGAPIAADAVGNTAGHLSGKKVGDAVLRFTGDSACAGGAVVIEAKRDGSYTVAKALTELGVARSNRDAAVGLFVMSKRHAPQGFTNLARHGRDVIVLWDEDDDTTDVYLHAAIILALGLVPRPVRPEEAGERDALADVEHRIVSELARHEKMRKLAESIRKDAEALGDELRKGDDKLNLLLRKAKDTLKALNVVPASPELDGMAVELPSGSLENARTALTVAA
jgi:hypothetical protein